MIAELPPVVLRYTAPELAALLGVSTFTLQRYRSEGTGPPYEQFRRGTRIHYRADLVEQWRQSTGRSSTSDGEGKN